MRPSLVSDRLPRKLRHLGDLLDADQIAVGGDGRPVNVVTCDCLPSITIALSSGSITPPPCDPLGPNAQSGRSVAGACGYALANRGHDTRALQAYHAVQEFLAGVTPPTTFRTGRMGVQS
jgi:hypothetical protein